MGGLERTCIRWRLNLIGLYINVSGVFGFSFLVQY